jgi:hypothetical protein
MSLRFREMNIILCKRLAVKSSKANRFSGADKLMALRFRERIVRLSKRLAAI